MKKNRQWFLKNAYWGVSVLLFVMIVAASFLVERAGKKDYRIVCLGDSIIGNVRDETSITAMLGDILGVSVYNGAFGGTTASCKNTENRADVAIDCVSLPELVDAICHENFAVQNASIGSYVSMDYFPEGVYGFNDIDWSKVEVVVIEHGVNDYLTGTKLDNPQDPYDIYTYGGALRTALRELQEKKPELRIILCTPTYCWFVADEVSCEERNLGGGYLEEYANLELQIAEEFGVEIIDNYHDSGIGGDFTDWPVYTEDGLHLNETGRKMIAERIAAVIETGGKCRGE
ncbi:MAG: SGNH/GDSL hydrolase family protein [Lachnospiraceae bacterium]